MYSRHLWSYFANDTLLQVWCYVCVRCYAYKDNDGDIVPGKCFNFLRSSFLSLHDTVIKSYNLYQIPLCRWFVLFYLKPVSKKDYLLLFTIFINFIFYVILFIFTVVLCSLNFDNHYQQLFISTFYEKHLILTSNNRVLG